MAQRILVVEDEEAIRLALVDTLIREGFQVLQATDGASGFKEALAHEPDLILLDNRLPEQSGYSMLRQLRKESPWGARVPVIFLSNVRINSKEEQEDIEDVGAAAYLMKSDTSMADIVTKIKSLLA